MIKILNRLAFLDFPASDAADIYPLARLPPSGINIVNLSPWWTSLGLTMRGKSLEGAGRFDRRWRPSTGHVTT
jgi:hypothetical protein